MWNAVDWEEVRGALRTLPRPTTILPPLPPPPELCNARAAVTPPPSSSAHSPFLFAQRKICDATAARKKLKDMQTGCLGSGAGVDCWGREGRGEGSGVSRSSACRLAAWTTAGAGEGGEGRGGEAAAR